MSVENVEVVREAMSLMNVAGRDREAARRLVDLFDPEVRIDMSRRVFNPDIYEGYEGLRRLGGEVRDVWEEFRIEPERFVDAGDTVVVVEKRYGRGRGSGIDVEQRSAVIWTLRDGKIIAMETDVDTPLLRSGGGTTSRSLKTRVGCWAHERWPAELVMRLEEEFEVEIPDEDAEKIRTVKDALTYIEEKSKG